MDTTDTEMLDYDGRVPAVSVEEYEEARTSHAPTVHPIRTAKVRAAF